jgi:hypothetical protein
MVCRYKIFQGKHSLRFLGSFPNKFLGQLAIQEVHTINRDVGGDGVGVGLASCTSIGLSLNQKRQNET